MSHGVGVERTFQTHSHQVESITVKRRGDVRQAKLYYLRDLTGRAARITEKLTKKGDAAVESVLAEDNVSIADQVEAAVAEEPVVEEAAVEETAAEETKAEAPAAEAPAAEEAPAADDQEKKED